MLITNRLEYWRAQYSAKVGRIVKQTEFSELLGISRGQYNRYEKHETEPSLKVYDKILERLRSLFLDKKIELEDLYNKES